jgi:sulfide:quinone oxidoreductase
MSGFHWVTPDFAVAPQISATEAEALGAAGFKSVINNRPDHEQTGQPLAAELGAIIKRQGLGYTELPFQGAPPREVVEALAAAWASLPKPVLAYCRTGTRSIMAWAMAQVRLGTLSPQETIALAAKAGYDIEALSPALSALATKG